MEAVISRTSINLTETNSFTIAAITGGSDALDTVQAVLCELDANLPLVCLLLENVSEGESSKWSALVTADQGNNGSLAILPAADGQMLTPGHAYLLPTEEQAALGLNEGSFCVMEREAGRGDHPIDCLLRMLADEGRRQSLVAVLAGPGHAGSRGIRHVYEAGGYVVVQEMTPEVSGDPSMPRAAQETGFVDAALPAGDLVDLVRQRSTGAAKPPTALAPAPLPSDEELSEIFSLLHDLCGIDFNLYKPTTVLRRLQRRLAMLEITSFSDYTLLLQDDPEELAALYHDLLVGVTKFFRNPEAFDHLAKEVLPQLIQDLPGDTGLRAWLAGCASGEEVYTLAILIAETLRTSGRELPVKIFATDIHARAIDTASTGHYSEEVLENVPEHLRKRYFNRVEGGYQVSRTLRQSVVFAQHDLLTSAPFTRMNLIVCRNLLIYLKPAAQRQVLSLLHFGLRKGGVLFLGPSESVSALAEDFEPINEHWKIFRKRSNSRFPKTTERTEATLATARPLPAPPSWRQELSGSGSSSSKLIHVYDRVLDQVMPPALLVDEQLHLVHSFGGAERYLTLRGGRASSRLSSLLCEPLRTPVSVAIDQARRTGPPAEPVAVTLSDPSGGAQEVTMTIRVRPLGDESGDAPYLLVLFEGHNPSGDPSLQSTHPVSLDEMTCRHIANLEKELQFSRDHLQTTVEELDASNEELQAANEELVASNEELQSSNEEYQSVNEELQTVNTELKRKISELSQMTSDMEGLLDNTGLGVVFLDRHRRVRRFTSKMTELFHFLPQDVGRPITHFASHLELRDLDRHLNTVMEKNVSTHLEIRDRQGTTYLLRASPYLRDGRVDGAVLTFVDVSPLRFAQAEARRLEQMVESSHDAIICTDADLIVLHWNRGAERLFGYSKREAEGRSVIETIVPPEFAQDALQRTRQACEGEVTGRIETFRRRKDGRYLDVLASIDRMVNDRDEVVGILAVLQDNSEARRLACGLAVEKEVGLALAESPTLDVALPSIISAFHDVLNTSVAELWLPSEDAKSLKCRLVHCEATNRAASEWRRLATASNFYKGQGLPGRVWQTEQPLWIDQLADSSSFARRGAVEALKVHCAFAFPILTDTSEVLGVMVFFLPYPRVSQPLPHSMLASLGRDIGYFMERRKSEALALEERSRFMVAVRHASVFVAQCDLNLRYTWVADGNPDFPPDRLEGRSDDEIFPPASAETLVKAKRRAIDEDRTTKCDVVIPLTQGERTFAATFEPLHDDTGAVLGLNLVGFDVTELHRALAEKSRLASIIEATPDFVAVADASCRLLSLNPAARKMLGIASNEDVRGLPLSALYGEEAASMTAEKAIPAALQSPQGTWMGETVFTTRRGTEIPMSQVIIARTGEDGELLYLAMVARDLRDRMRIENELRGLSETLAAIVQGLPEIVFVVDMDGNMTFASAAADSINRALDSPKLPTELTGKIRSALEKGQDYLPSDFKAAHALRIGHKVHYFLPQITAFKNPQGERLGALIVLQDITEFRLLDEVKSNLIGTVSHELKTPLTGIRMPLLMVLDESDQRGRLNDRQRKLLQSASSEVERMLTTLTMLLDLTRFEEGPQAIPKVPCDPGDLIHDTARQLEPQAAHAGVQIKIEVQPHLPAVMADSNRILHALTNLVSNALKHAPEGSHVTLGARRIKAGIRFFVRDEGPGIPTEYHKRLFDRFFKVPGSEGTGLGLAIVREFVRAHGGKVGVKSQPGQGSTFHFTLPARQNSDAPNRA